MKYLKSLSLLLLAAGTLAFVLCFVWLIANQPLDVSLQVTLNVRKCWIGIGLGLLCGLYIGLRGIAEAVEAGER